MADAVDELHGTGNEHAVSPARTGQSEILLLSGGLDSAALAYWRRPLHTLFVDYGQRPASAERRASRAIADELTVPWTGIRIDLRSLGSGLLADDTPNTTAPSPEWWPFRNQFLATIAAAWAINNDLHHHAVILGTFASDGTRHRDGTTTFYNHLDTLISYQEGGINVSAPAIAMTTHDLIEQSQVPDRVIGWTHSCHRADIPCGDCPGCHKRQQVTDRLGRLP